MGCSNHGIGGRGREDYGDVGGRAICVNDASSTEVGRRLRVLPRLYNPGTTRACSGERDVEVWELGDAGGDQGTRSLARDSLLMWRPS